MTFELFLTIVGICLPLYIFYTYKFASHLTNAYLYRKFSGISILLVMAFTEYYYHESLVMGLVAVLFLAWESLKLISVVGIIAYIVLTKKTTDKEIDSYRLFFTNIRIRSFFKSENPNVYFIKKNGLKIYFDSTSHCFEVMSDLSLDRFKLGIKEEKLKDISLQNFLILSHQNQYVSVSTDDLLMLDIDLLNIDKNHFDILRMFKI